jgi:5-methylcytosine-specific restriction endonuclease McrA
MIIHLVKIVLKPANHLSQLKDIIKTVCGKTVKQDEHERNVNCPKCLAIQFPSNGTVEPNSNNTFTCFYCGRIMSDKYHELDHKIPLSRGGRNILDNLVNSCRDCNRAKGDMTAQEYLRTFK